MTPDVPCAGCGKPTPYAVGENASHGEWHSVPLGLCYVRTHRRRACVLAARKANGVEHATKLPPAREEKAQRELATPDQLDAAA